MKWWERRNSALKRMAALDIVALEAEVEFDLHCAFCHEDDCEYIPNKQKLFLRCIHSAVLLSQSEDVPLTPYLNMKWRELEAMS